MSFLVVEPLKDDELVQPINLLLDTRVHVAGLYPYIYMHNQPVGDFTFGIRKTDGSVDYSFEFDSAHIKNILDTSNNYAHVFMPVIPTYPLRLEKGEYELYLSAENYMYNLSSFLGWIKQYQHRNNELNYTPSNDGENPLAYRLKMYKEGILCR